ncbi:MAG: hypothetical protein ACD_20C00330G0019 [uncultured bacterium]|nr:MAG: hypothetical protein ACD_20C00330G0019 [uncultured bacterium]
MNISNLNPILKNNQFNTPKNLGATKGFAPFTTSKAVKDADKTTTLQNSIGVINPPDILTYNPMQEINNKKQEVSTDQKKPESFFKSLDTKKLLIIAGTGLLVIAAIKGGLNKVKNKPITTFEELKKYAANLSQNSPKKINITFSSQASKNKAREVAETINYAIEETFAGKKQGQTIRIILDSAGYKAKLDDYLLKTNGNKIKLNKELAQILKKVRRIETVQESTPVAARIFDTIEPKTVIKTEIFRNLRLWLEQF